MSTVTLKNVYKVYSNATQDKKNRQAPKPAVSDFSMEINDKEFIVFVGPSGCGKSTTLRMIAGLEEITSGEIYIDDKLVNDVEPKDRDIAMVFQNYALYPHMSVFDNMAFGLKLRKIPDVRKDKHNNVVFDKAGKPINIMRHYTKAEINERVRQAAEILGITEYLGRKPKALSGGQRQRVALGRAIVRNPKVFLLDEPLSNLDAKLRAAMRSEITKLHEKLATTFIYVTHDQVEAMTMGTRIVVMKDGFIQQIDTPQNLYDYPANKFVAGFIGTPQMNFYNGTVDPEGNIIFAGGQHLALSADKLNTLDKSRLSETTEIILGIRPEDFSLSDGSGGIACRVDVVEELGSEALLYGSLDLDSTAVVTDENDSLSVIAKVNSRCRVNRNSTVQLYVNIERVHIFEVDTGKSLTSTPPQTPN